jgi:hypothetical protein
MGPDHTAHNFVYTTRVVYFIRNGILGSATSYAGDACSLVTYKIAICFLYIVHICNKIIVIVQAKQAM